MTVTGMTRAADGFAVEIQFSRWWIIWQAAKLAREVGLPLVLWPGFLLGMARAVLFSGLK